MTSYGRIDIDDYERVTGRRPLRRWLKAVVVVVPLAFSVGWVLPSPVWKHSVAWTNERSLRMTASDELTERELGARSLFRDVQAGIDALVGVAPRADASGRSASLYLGHIAVHAAAAILELESLRENHLSTHRRSLDRLRKELQR